MRNVYRIVAHPFYGVLSALLMVTLLCGPLRAETHVVNSSKALIKAYRAADPGDRIMLAPGSYSALKLKGGGGAAKRPVTIVSQDLSNPARLSGLILRDAAHVVIDAVVMDYTYQRRDALKARPFKVESSRNIVLSRLIFDGDMASGLDVHSNGLPAGFGLAVAKTDGLILRDSEFRHFWRGLTMRESRNLQIIRNDLHSIRMDGMNFAQVENVLIEGNKIRDFLRALKSADHADMIQFWTAHTTAPSRNVTIRGNLLNSGKGLFTQSIFIGNTLVSKGQAGEEMYFRDFTIENNLIINAHKHGIAVGAAFGVRVANNTLVHNPTSDGPRDIQALYRPQVSVSPLSRDVVVENNVALGFKLKQGLPTWKVAGNLKTQDTNPSRPNHYSTLFTGTNPRDPASFKPKPGSALDGTGIGVKSSWWR